MAVPVQNLMEKNHTAYIKRKKEPQKFKKSKPLRRRQKMDKKESGLTRLEPGKISKQNLDHFHFLIARLELGSLRPADRQEMG